MTKARAVDDRFNQKRPYSTNRKELDGPGDSLKVLKKLTEYPTGLTSWGQATDKKEAKDGLETGNKSGQDKGEYRNTKLYEQAAHQNHKKHDSKRTSTQDTRSKHKYTDRKTGYVQPNPQLKSTEDMIGWNLIGITLNDSRDVKSYWLPV